MACGRAKQDGIRWRTKGKIKTINFIARCAASKPLFTYQLPIILRYSLPKPLKALSVRSFGGLVWDTWTRSKGTSANSEKRVRKSTTTTPQPTLRTVE